MENHIFAKNENDYILFLIIEVISTIKNKKGFLWVHSNYETVRFVLFSNCWATSHDISYMYSDWRYCSSKEANIL